LRVKWPTVFRPSPRLPPPLQLPDQASIDAASGNASPINAHRRRSLPDAAFFGGVQAFRRSLARVTSRCLRRVARCVEATVTVRDDPCHLAWQVSEIPWLESELLILTRPLPARPAGESDSDADDCENGSNRLRAAESHSPATRGGRGLGARLPGSSNGISFTCRASRQGSSQTGTSAQCMNPTAQLPLQNSARTNYRYAGRLHFGVSLTL